jgi:hypothetical protein
LEIKVDQPQPNVGTFDCSELTQWASGTPQECDVRKGDWITDVTYESDTGSHALYQDVFVPTLDTETLIIAHEGFWY